MTKLSESLYQLGKTKISKPFSTNEGLDSYSADVSVSFLNKEAFVTLRSPKGRGVWPAILSSIESNNFNIVDARLSTDEDTHFHFVHALIADKVSVGSEELRLILEELVMEKLRDRQCVPDA